MVRKSITIMILIGLCYSNYINFAYGFNDPVGSSIDHNQSFQDASKIFEAGATTTLDPKEIATPTVDPIDPNTNNKKFSKETVPLTKSEEAQKYYEQGLKALANNQEMDAANLFRKTLQFNPKHHKSRIQLVKLYQKIGWFNENEKLLTLGLDLDPAHGDFIKHLGSIYLQKNQTRKALSVLLTMPEPYSHQIDYLALLALAYLQTEQPEIAIKYYKLLIQINKENPLWKFGLGIALEANENYSMAIKTFNQVKKTIGLDPVIVDYVNNRINIITKLLENHR